MIHKGPYKSFATDSFLVEERRFGAKARALLQEFGSYFDDTHGNIQKSIKQIFDTSLELLGNGMLSYWEFNENQTKLTCTITDSKNSERFGAIVSLDSHPKYFDAIYSNTVLAIENTRTHPATSIFWDNPLQGKSFESLIDIRVSSLGKNWGIVCYEVEDKIDFWPENRINFLSSIASLTADFINKSEEKHILNALIKANKELEIVMDTVNLGLWSYKFNDRSFNCNDRLLEIYGITREEMDGTISSFSKYWPQGMEKRVISLLRQLSRGHSFNNIPFTILSKNGQEKTVLVSGSPVYNEDGVLELASGVYHEITDLEFLRKERLDNEKRLAAILDSTNVGTWEWDLTTNDVIMNERCANIFGIPLEEIQTTKRDLWMHKMHPEDFPKASQNVREHFAGKREFYNVAVRLKQNRGNYVWVQEHGRVSTWNKDGSPIKIHGTTRIIHSEKITENALRELAGRLTNYSGKAYFDECLKYLCDELELEYGVIGKLVDDGQIIAESVYTEGIINSGFKYAFKDTPCSNTMADGVCVVKENAQMQYPKDQIFKEMDIQSYAGVQLQGSEGQAIGVLALFSKHPIYLTDIVETVLNLFKTSISNELERIKNESIRSQLIETTGRQNKRLKHFSFITSHNIRAAVSNIQGLTDLMIADGESSLSMLMLLKQATTNLDVSIKNTSDLLQLEERTGDLEVNPCSIPDIIQRILDQLSGLISTKNVDLDIDVPDPSEIYTNSAYLESILYNLISNAFKYGLNPQKPIIRIAASEQTGGFLFEVQDFGKGIDLDAYGEQIFELGSRLEQSTDGQGFGLFMTKHQIEILSGSMQIDSELGKGSNFKVFIPHFDQIETFKA